MKIGFLTGSITEIGSGRTEAVPLANALHKLGHSVYGLELSRFQRFRQNVESLEVHGEPLYGHLLSDPTASLNFIRGRFAPSSAFNDQPKVRLYRHLAGQALTALVERLDLDVLYVFHNTNAATIAEKWPRVGRALAVNLIGFGIDPPRGGASNTFPLQTRLFQRPVWDLHIAATKFEYEQYRSVYEKLGLEQQRLLHLPHPFDEARFSPPTHDAPPDPLLTDGAIQTLFYPVNVYPRKNIELAIEVLARVNTTSRAQLIVTGRIWDQRYYEQLTELAARLGQSERVHFLGGVPQERLIKLYRQVDLTIFTSHQETFGLGIVESLACGTPVVGPDWIVPSREILEESYGGWIAQKNPESFADGVRRALHEEPSSGRIAAEARRNYGNEAVAAKFLAKLDDVLQSKTDYTRNLHSIDWKGLYRDQGDLL